MEKFHPPIGVPNHPKKIFEFFFKTWKKEKFCQNRCSSVGQVAKRAGEEKQKLFWSGLFQIFSSNFSRFLSLFLFSFLFLFLFSFEFLSFFCFISVFYFSNFFFLFLFSLFYFLNIFSSSDNSALCTSCHIFRDMKNVGTNWKKRPTAISRVLISTINEFSNCTLKLYSQTILSNYTL